MKFIERRYERRSQLYSELRNLDYLAYRRAVETADCIGMNHGLELNARVDIEMAMVELALDLIKK